MKETKLYQVWSKDFEDEKFCFNAQNEQNAVIKLREWANYHSINSNNFELHEVPAPKYTNNIHNEWVGF